MTSPAFASVPGSRRARRWRTDRRRIASAVSKIGTPIARSGTPTETRNEFGTCEASGSVETVKPRNIDPASPRKTDAGW